MRADSGRRDARVGVFSRGGRLRFSVGFDLSEPIRAALLDLDEAAWVPALTQDGVD